MIKKVIALLGVSLVSLLFVGASQASTPEIDALEAFNQEAQSLAETPVSDENRTKLLGQLDSLQAAALASSERLLEIETLREIQLAQQDVADVNNHADSYIEEERKAYQQLVATIQQQAQSEINKVQVDLQKTLAAIQFEAAKRLAQGHAEIDLWLQKNKNTPGARQKAQQMRRDLERRVAEWRASQIAAAQMKARISIQRIRETASGRMFVAQKNYQQAVSEINLWRSRVIESIEEELDRTISELRKEAADRESYIKALVIETADLINQRPEDTPSVGVVP